MSHYNPYTPIYPNTTTIQAEINSLDASVAFSSDTEPAARTIALWADQGISTPAPPYGPYPKTTSRGATTSSGVGIDVDDNMTDINSISLIPVEANPGGATTVWIDSGTDHLMRGSVDVEAVGLGDVLGPASSVNKTLPKFSGTGGKTLIDTGIVINDLDAISGANCLKLNSVFAPDLVGSLWVDYVTGHLFFGDVDLQVGNGDVVGPTGCNDGAIPVYDDATGKLLGNSIVYVDGSGNVETVGSVIANDIELTGTVGGVGLFLPGNPGCIVQIGSSQFITLSTAATTSCVIGLGARLNDSLEGNCGIGYETFFSIIGPAADNSGFGNQALRSLTTGLKNAACGRLALWRVTTGSDNCGFGYQAGHALTTGSRDICIGKNSGENLTTENDNICIANAGVVSDAGVIRIGTSGTQVKNFQSGIRGITTDAVDAIPVLVSSTGQLGTVSSSIKYKENVKDLQGSEIIYKLRPVEFKYKQNTDSDKTSIGLIAEECESVYPEMCIYQPIEGTDEKELLTVDYSRLAILLLKEVQGLNDKYHKLILQNTVLASEIKLLKNSIGKK
jgi:hypothetical protein